MKFKHYLFDLDGTITSTKEIHQKSFNQALEFFNKKIVEDKDLVLYEAMPSFDKLKLYNELNKEDINPDDFLLIKNYYSNQNIEKSEELYDEGVFNIFKYLKNKGSRISICSNCTKASIILILSKMRIEGFVDAIYHNKSCEPKPSPEIYRIAMLDSKIKQSESNFVYKLCASLSEVKRANNKWWHLIASSKASCSIT